jgi:hypothetical protein
MKYIFMKKILFALIILLILPNLAFADGMPFPRRFETLDFSAVQEKQQYASVEVLSNYFEKMNLYLALTSIDYENHNITVVIPMKSIPQDVSGDKIKASEFLSKYGFNDVQNLIEKQSLDGFVKKVSPQTKDALGEYIMLSLISPLYELSKVSFFYPMYDTLAAPAMRAVTGGEALPSGVTPIAKYEFEGATVEIYGVTSGQTLEEFMRDYYNLDLPENVRDSVDTYKMHYIAILNAVIGPPGDVSLLKQYAPNTFKDAVRYVKSNPEFSFTCYGYGPYYAQSEIARVPPYYGECTDREIIRQKFSDYIERAKTEASSAPLNLTPVSIYNSGFESGYSYWNNYGYSGYGGLGTAGFNFDSSTFYKGSSSLYVYDTSSNGWVGVCQQINNVVPGKKYIASAWAKAKEGTIRIWLADYPGSWKTGNYITSKEWNYYNTEYTTNSNSLYVCLGTSDYEIGSGWFDDVSVQIESSSVEDAMIDFFLNAYSNSTKGIELSMTLPIKNNEIFYPLGTGSAWSTPIEDTKVLVKMDKKLDVNFENVQDSAIDSSNRYYLWSFKNWNPDYDIKGTLDKAGATSMIGDSGKLLLESMSANSEILAIVFMIVVIIVAGLIAKSKGRGDVKKRTFFMILSIIFAPLISIWAVALLAYGLKTKTKKEELKENLINVLIFLGVIVLLWVFMAVISIIIGG